MVFNVHARKLPVEKSRNIARHGMRVRLVANAAVLGNLKVPDPSSAFDESVVYRRKNGNLHLRSSQQSAQVAQNWPERGEK